MSQLPNCCDSEVAYTVVELADSLNAYSQIPEGKMVINEPSELHKTETGHDENQTMESVEEIVINESSTSDVDILSSLNTYNNTVNTEDVTIPPAISLLSSNMLSGTVEQPMVAAAESQHDVFSSAAANDEEDKNKQQMWSSLNEQPSVNVEMVGETFESNNVSTVGSEGIGFEKNFEISEQELSKSNSSWQLQLSPSQQQRNFSFTDSTPSVACNQPESVSERCYQNEETPKESDAPSLTVSSEMCAATTNTSFVDHSQKESQCQTETSEYEEYEIVFETIQRKLKKRYIVSKDHNGYLIRRYLTNVVVQEEKIHSKIADIAATDSERIEPLTCETADGSVSPACHDNSSAEHLKSTDDRFVDASYLPNAAPVDSLSDNEIKPETTPSESMTPDEPEKRHLKPGSKVYAKWSDSCFYSGSVCKIVGNKYEVLFDDNFRYCVKERDIIPHAAIVSNASIMVQGGDGCYEPAIIKEIIAKPPEYTVETDDGRILRVSKSGIMLTLDQVSALFPRLDSPLSNKSKSSVSLDNVIGGKRRRKPRSIENAPHTVPAKRGKFVKDQTDQNHSFTVAVNSSRKSTGRKSSFSKIRRNKNIFSGLMFVVTMSSRTDDAVTSLSTSVDMTSKDGKCELLDKRNIKQLIVSHGGQMCEDIFNDTCNRQKTYLISNTESRTLKYLICVGCGIPCISYRWILDCINKNKLLDWTVYRLPNGVSIETGEVVQWLKYILRVTDFQPVFKDQKTIILSPNDDFISTCKSLLLSAGCHIIQLASTASAILDENLEIIDFIVSDNAKDLLSIIEERRRCNVPLMTLEWIIQSVICGSRRDPSSHTSYNWQLEN